MKKKRDFYQTLFVICDSKPVTSLDTPVVILKTQKSIIRIFCFFFFLIIFLVKNRKYI